MLRTFLVTGATGLVGTAVVPKLAGFGSVTGLSRTAPAQGNGMSFLRHDVAAPFPDWPELQGSTVVHCAAELRSREWQPHWNVNVVGTRNLLAWCTRREVPRLILLSTGGVYGYHKDRRMRECDPTSPFGAYAQTKYAAEQEALAYAERHGLQLVVFRLYFPFAKHQSSGVFRRVEDSIRGTSPLRINREGKPRITPVHLSDVADAIALAADVAFPTGCYNLCGDEDVSFLELVRGMELRLGMKANLGYTDESSGDMMGCNESLRRLGWRPRRGLSDIIDVAE